MFLIIGLLLFFLCIGLFVQKYSVWTRLLMLLLVTGVAVLFYFT